MDISDLKIFRAVAETGGISRAAERLHRVPSNVTTRIRQLEDGLDVALFLREGNRLQISPAGTVLLDYAKRIISLAQEAEEALHDVTPRGILRLGAMESTAAIRLPRPLTGYHKRYPDVSVELCTGSTQVLLAQVLNGEVDAALVADPMVDDRLEGVHAFREELVIIAAAGHAPIKSPRDVEGEAMLVFRTGCAYRKKLEAWFAASGAIPSRVVELSSFHAIYGCTVAGMGIGILPRSILDTFPEASSLSVHPLPADQRQSDTVMVWRKGTVSAKIAALSAMLAYP